MGKTQHLANCLHFPSLLKPNPSEGAAAQKIHPADTNHSSRCSAAPGLVDCHILLWVEWIVMRRQVTQTQSNWCKKSNRNFIPVFSLLYVSREGKKKVVWVLLRIKECLGSPGTLTACAGEQPLIKACKAWKHLQQKQFKPDQKNCEESLISTYNKPQFSFYCTHDIP